jgi:putative acetyltransferase
MESGLAIPPLDVPGLSIRRATGEDRAAVYGIHASAFGGEAEARLVGWLEEEGSARVSLVAVTSGGLVAHIRFSPLRIGESNGPIRALALAPLAVLRAWQRRGTGSALVRAGLAACRAEGYRIIIVVGDPMYYRRFGSSSEAALPLQSPYAGEHFMAMELVTGALRGVFGRVIYPEPFDRLS